MARARELAELFSESYTVEQVLAGASEMAADILESNEAALRTVTSILLKKERISVYRIGKIVGIETRMADGLAQPVGFGSSIREGISQAVQRWA